MISKPAQITARPWK